MGVLGGQVEVKICGIVRPHDARVAEEAGADAIGLIFVPRSPRCVTPQQARAIRATVARVCCVGVFANADPRELLETVDTVGLDLVQLHGQEDLQYCQTVASELGVHRIIKAIRFTEQVDYELLAPYADAGIRLLVDGAFGGGPLPWHRLSDWHTRLAVPLILAGGLTPENVGTAVTVVRPAAVDVARGVEASGKSRAKDPAKIVRFVQAARNAAACSAAPQQTATRAFVRRHA